MVRAAARLVWSAAFELNVPPAVATPRPPPRLHWETLITEVPGVGLAGTTVNVLTPDADAPEPDHALPMRVTGLSAVMVTVVVVTAVPQELVTE